jgi:DNA mismatch repair ATPase MutS
VAAAHVASPAIRATALGHPLIDPDRCVRNDVEVPAPGRLLLVTGSNMAGKTTLLRALGVNQALALAGGPVAASAFDTSALLPWCAMRVRDSLESGVSYFLAELQRLRAVVEAARAVPSLFLLDEILQGTNSEERRIAAQIVLGELLRTESVGAITTHDLSLAAGGELAERAVNVHFREDVESVDGKHVLHFDYRLRPGPATSRNALLLLEIVGLVPSGADASP